MKIHPRWGTIGLGVRTLAHTKRVLASPIRRCPTPQCTGMVLGVEPGGVVALHIAYPPQRALSTEMATVGREMVLPTSPLGSLVMPILLELPSFR